MSISSFCISQRQKEQQQLKKLLIFGFAGSALLHGLLGYALPYLSVESPQVEKPMELIVIEQPKPKPQPKKTKIVPKPKAKSGSSQPKSSAAKAPTPKAPAPAPKPPEPKPEPKPEPPQPKAVEPKPQPPEPKPEPPQPKAPAPRKILTSNLPALDNTPTVSQPQQEISPNSNTSASAKESSSQMATNSSNVGGTGTGTGTGTDTGDEEGIACLSNCEPEYPAELEGAEGSAGVKLTIDPDGNVVGAELTDADENSQINRQALLAAREMEFSSLPDDNAVSVRVKIDFTVEGSEYDRLAREEQERKEQADKEKQEQETARQQQQQREQVEQARIRQQQQQREQAEVKPKPPVPDSQVTPKPLPALMETGADEEQLRKFRERIENYQQK